MSDNSEYHELDFWLKITSNQNNRKIAKNGIF